MILESRDIYDLIEFLKNQGKSSWADEIDDLYVRWKAAFERVREQDEELARLKSKDKYEFDESPGFL